MEDEAGDAWIETRHLACEYEGLCQQSNRQPSQSLDDVNNLTRGSLTDIAVRQALGVAAIESSGRRDEEKNG